MPNRFFWLSPETVTEINKILVAETGEPHQVIDQMRLEGALQRPYNMCAYGGEDDVFRLGVNYMVSISEAHAYLQGNKRTGFVSGRNFFQNNGYDLIIPDHEETATLLIAVIEKDAKIEDLEAHLEPFVVETDE